MICRKLETWLKIDECLLVTYIIFMKKKSSSTGRGWIMGSEVPLLSALDLVQAFPVFQAILRQKDRGWRNMVNVKTVLHREGIECKES